MLDVTKDPARIRVWVAMAEQFLDNETRQDIPLIALYCLQAGLSVAAAREVWCFEVTPAVGLNLWNVAGEWAGWDREWLLAEIARARRSWPQRSWARWPLYAARLPIAHCYWRAIARCMQVLQPLAESERERTAGCLALLGAHYFDVWSQDFRTLPDDQLQRCAALYPEPFLSALEPATFCQEARAADRRVRAALYSGSRWLPAAIDPWSHFSQALERVGASRSGRALFDELVARYGESQRHYHTLDHISACLGWLDGCATLARRPAEIALGLWFHDAVYEPRASDNESRSAELARDRLSPLGVAKETVGRIAALVLATRDHFAEGDADAQLLIDIDLSILGTSPELFDDFERRIRREYAHAGPMAFRLGRRRVLRRLLERQHIYRTPALREQLEVRARANLERRMRELARGI